MDFILSKDTTLSDELLVKMLTKSQADRARYKKLEDYYLGKNIILKRVMADSNKPNNKIADPFASYITDTLCGYFVGEPITYNSLDEEALDALNQTLIYNDTADVDMELARTVSIYGRAYELHYIDADGANRFSLVKPIDMDIVRDDSLENDILYAIRKVPQYDILTDKTTYKIELYNAETVKVYTTNETMSAVNFVSEEPHYYGMVPVVEYINNEQKLGDFEQVISLIDAYDKLESDSLNDFESFTDAYLVLTGLTADSDDIAAMRENRVLLLDEDSSAEWLVKSTNDANIQNIKDRIQSDIHKFAKVPDLSDESFSGNTSGIAIKYKLYGTETLISTKERKFMKGLQRRIELIFNILALKGMVFDWRSIEINFTRNLPANVNEIADIIQKLSGAVSRETLLAQVPFITDVNAEMERLEKDRERNPFYNLDIETAEDNKPEEE
jgi:SPP1 family phage portal protein